MDFESYERSRKLSEKALPALCYAPFTSLYFDNGGNVRVCCHNSNFPVGNIRESSIDQIWNGEPIRKLRQALARYEFGPGCDFCMRQTAETYANAAMRRYDKFPVESGDPKWPRQIEFSISNSCNLECIMCRGFWSSAIRARREKLPPLPRHYGEAFFSQLKRYLPHLSQLKFLGGEPFLISEYYRIWEMLIAEGLSPLCHVTTNGTQCNDKVLRIIEQLPFGFAISIDGATKETHESIRVNAKFEAVMENAKLFREYAKSRNTSFSITFCLMRMNWQEFGAFCQLADSWDCAAGINTVVSPPEFGIYSLPPEGLRRVLSGMEGQAPTLERELGRNKQVWFGELERIRARVRKAERASLAILPA